MKLVTPEDFADLDLRVDDHAAPDEPDRGNDEALLIDLSCDWHRAWAHASDVGVVGAVGCIKRRGLLPAEKHW